MKDSKDVIRLSPSRSVRSEFRGRNLPVPLEGNTFKVLRLNNGLATSLSQFRVLLGPQVSWRFILDLAKSASEVKILDAGTVSVMIEWISFFFFFSLVLTSLNSSVRLKSSFC